MACPGAKPLKGLLIVAGVLGWQKRAPVCRGTRSLNTSSGVRGFNCVVKPRPWPNDVVKTEQQAPRSNGTVLNVSSGCQRLSQKKEKRKRKCAPNRERGLLRCVFACMRNAPSKPETIQNSSQYRETPTPVHGRYNLLTVLLFLTATCFFLLPLPPNCPLSVETADC